MSMYSCLLLMLCLLASLATGNEEFRKQWLSPRSNFLFFPFLIMGALEFAKSRGGTPFMIAHIPAAVLLSTTFAGVLWFFNKRQPSIFLFFCGALSNASVIRANEGKMPVDPVAYKALIGTLDYLPTRCVFMTRETNWPLLGDWIYIPYSGCILSAGDLLITSALCVLIAQYLIFRYKKTRT